MSASSACRCQTAAAPKLVVRFQVERLALQLVRLATEPAQHWQAFGFQLDRLQVVTAREERPNPDGCVRERAVAPQKSPDSAPLTAAGAWRFICLGAACSKGLVTKVETQFKLHWLEGYFIAGARASDFAAKRRGAHASTPTVEPTKDQPFRLILYPSTVNVDPGSVAFPGGTIDLHPLPAVSHAAGYVPRAQADFGAAGSSTAKQQAMLPRLWPVVRSRKQRPDRQEVPVLQFSLTTRTPCPALPLYGTNLQLRLARLELTIYEDLLLGYRRRAMPG